MHARRLSSEAVAAGDPAALAGAVLLAPVRAGARLLAKGTQLDERLARELRDLARAGALATPLRLGWADPGDLHEDEAAFRLARAAGGDGVRPSAARQSRVDLAARIDGVLRVKISALAEFNRIDPLELFTLFHGQAVRAGQVVASVKVAPHLVAGAAVAAGEAVAAGARPLVDVDPYLPLEVAAIAAEPLGEESLRRFADAAATKVAALGGRFLGVTPVPDTDPDRAAARLGEVLTALVRTRRVPLVLIGGVSAGDPLSPFYEALATLGGTVLRRGVPAHPGSMIWLAGLDASTILGLPQCGMFSMATAADLVLPRLLTGERVHPDTLADLGHGGLLGREMRFRFPDYARDLEAPE